MLSREKERASGCGIRWWVLVRGEGRVPKSTPRAATDLPHVAWQPPPALGDSFYVAFHRNDFNTQLHQTKARRCFGTHTHTHARVEGAC
jgi:hypothetical protein